jgi:hypothetical protein
MMGAAAATLIKNGLISGSADEDPKIRGLQYNQFPPNSVNISGLNRYMNGKDPAVQDGDHFVNLTKMGIIGAVLGVRTNVREKSEEISKENTKSKQMAADLWASLIEIPAYSLEQSFLRGTSSLLQAINDGQWDYWLTNTFQAVSSVPLPNTLASINRATRQYVPDLRGNNLEERLSNVIKNKTFETEDLPVKIDLWGKPILQNPEGTNGWIYQLFDITKSQNITTNPASHLIYNVYKKTQNADVVPSVPSRKLTVGGTKVELDDKQYEVFLRNVGAARYSLVQDYINKGEFKGRNYEEIIKILDKLYSSGYDLGRAQTLKNQTAPND